MTVHLLDFPLEILLRIFSWVPTRALLLDASLVCKRFHEILRTEWYWRGRYVEETRAQPLVEQPSTRSWQVGCLHWEFAWMAAAGALNCSTPTGTGIAGDLDCVHLMYPDLHGANSLVAAGSRDCNVYLWRRRSGGKEEGRRRSMRTFTGTQLAGHRGWVWSLTSDPQRPQLLYSGSWDSSVRVWDVTVAKDVANITGQHKAAVLCLATPQPNVLASGSYDKRVRVLDMRVPVSVVSSHQEHSRPVLCLAATEHYLYSGSEDKSVCVWDRRADQLLQRVKLGSLVTSLHQGYGMVSVAEGSVVNIYNCSNGALQKISSFTPGHSRPLTCVYHTLGMIATSSQDGTVMIHTTGGGQCLRTIDHHTSAVTQMDFGRNTLALASSDRSVSLWTPY